MNRRPTASTWALPAALGVIVLAVGPLLAFVIDTQWDDFALIVMDNVFQGGNWAAVAEGELAKWNEIRGINDQPFRINQSPEFLFDSNDGDNTMGFLGEAALMAEYSLTYGPSPAAPNGALAWCATLFDGSTREIFEADIMFDPSLVWSESPDGQNPFTSVMLHESGHAQGLNHSPFRLSIMFPSANSQVAATLFSDDWAGIDSSYTLLQEVDVQALSVWHDTTQPRWMTISTNFLTEGQPITFTNFTWENRGNLNAPNPEFRIVLSDSPSLTPPLTVIDTWTEAEIRGHDYTTQTRTVTLPQMPDCAVKYAGLFIPSNAPWNERFEQNNKVVFKNGSSAPAPITIVLVPDVQEPNGGFGIASNLPTPLLPDPPVDVNLSINSDIDHDFFQFFLPGTRYVDAVIGYSGAAGDLDLIVYDTNMVPLGPVTNGQDFSEFRQQLAPGWYFVEVLGNGPGSCNHYNLKFWTMECIYTWECDPTSTTFCQSRTCDSNLRCVDVVPRPCDDGDPCTRDICNQDHGGYCLFAPDPNLDPDGDGVCASLDCMPEDSEAWAPPAEASSLAIESDAQTLSWETLAAQAGPGTVYDLMRGSWPASPAASSPGELCVAGLGAAVTQDATLPDPGETFWYVVRGRNACGTGTFGSSTSGVERPVAPCE